MQAVRAIVIFACAARLSAAVEPALLRFTDFGPGGGATAIVPGTNGEVYVLGTVGLLLTPTIRRIDAQGRLISSTTSECNAVAGVVDSKGNLTVAGQGRVYSRAAYSLCVVKFDAALASLTFTKVIANTAADASQIIFIGAVASDASDNIYLAGRTRSRDFPVTPNAVEKAVVDSNESAFVMKLSPHGAILYSTLLGNSGPLCSCAPTGDSQAQFVSVDKSGNITVAGVTNSVLFPVTAGALNTGCGCIPHAPTPFVTHLRADGSLDWSARIPTPNPDVPLVKTFLDSISANSDGSMLLATENFGSLPDGSPFSETRVDRLAAGGASVTSQTFPVTGSTIASNGVLWAIDLNSLSTVELQTGKLLTTVALPADVNKPRLAKDSENRIIALRADGSILTMKAPPSSGVLGLTNSAEYHVSANVAPGELVSLYGIQIGPPVAAPAQLTAENRLPFTLAGTEVRFDGTAAPLLYAGPNQINLVVPFEVAGKDSVQVELRQSGSVVSTFVVPVAEAHPAIFHRHVLVGNAVGDAIALNEDGTLNSALNPARSGSIVTIWVTGAGAFEPALGDGGIANGDAKPKLPLGLPYGGTLQYGGSAPGMLNGVLQINVLTTHNPFNDFRLSVGPFLPEVLRVFVE